MKIIHTADLHLDSAMKTHLDSEKASERKNELTLNFSRLCETAESLGVTGIIIAGDLFDTKSVSKKSAAAVLNQIIKFDGIDFYYLRGNHDRESFISFIKESGEIPANLHMFEDAWTSYVLNPESNGKKTVLYGAEFNGDNTNTLISLLNTDFENINIVTLHGQENEYSGKDKTEIVPISELRGKGIDYLALGHVHEYRLKTLDSRGTYCYPGCLEGRGFDECGDHGFVLLDIDEEKGDVIPQFIDFAYRKLHTADVDISECDNSSEIIDKARAVLDESRFSDRDMVKIRLTGDVDENAEVNEDFIADAFKDEYYFVKVKNESKVKIDYMKYANDESLKGWFIRLVQDSEEIDDEDKGRIVRMGLNALTGEEIMQ
ncbi:MAG: metallophosphoesterase [Lachnospiraceae bacterium]|nr:metallophosphoesterase [Lachnospiraceae bacterium]